MSFLLRLRNIPLCVYTTFCLCAHSSAGGGFHLLMTVSNAAMHICVDKHLLESLPLILMGIYIPRSGIAGPYGNALFHFLRSARLSSAAAAP